MDYNKYKSYIWDLINSDNLSTNDISNIKDILKKIDSYHFYDVDIMYFKTFIEFFNGNINKSEYLCKKILSITPFHFHTNKLLVFIYIENKNYDKLNNYFKFLGNLLNLENFPYIDVVKNLANYIMYFFENTNIPLYKNLYRNSNWGRPIENFSGKILKNYLFTNKLIQNREYFNQFYKNLRLNGFKQYENQFLENNKNYILPLYSFEDDNVISLFNNKQNKDIKFILNSKNYYLFNINGNPNLQSNKDIFIGKPIPRFKYEKNKDLVLTLFIDGLSQSLLEENGGLETLMPNTYKFFKESLYFTNCYVSGEWTYVSLASYFTGQYTTNHKLFHPGINASLRDDVKILSEYINDKNYFTSKIDGDWRSNFPCGYYRGFDHILYEPSGDENMTVKELPSLLIDHMETFKDTNMYIFTAIPDLHDIADCYSLCYPIQAVQDFDEKPIIEDYEFGATSVRNKYYKPKIKSYIRMLKYIDTHLRSLYAYLEDNFDMDNITVTLISDHGQGYFVKPEEEFLSDGRVKVPLLIKSKEVENIKCNEFVQNEDYIAIMDKILGLNVNYKKIDANLPACLGGKAREYTYSESLFPDAPYRALINIKNYEFYFETKENVEFDGRVVLENYRTYLKDKSTKEDVVDDEILNKCIDIVFEHMKYNRIYR